jgi:valyl-tRNA synthetase
LVQEALQEFRFDQAANTLYHFVWSELCDWYIEIAKVLFADPKHGPQTRTVLLEVLEKSLRLLHPFMPYVTEEIWQRLPHDGASIMIAPFPEKQKLVFVGKPMDDLIALVTAIRTIRATYEVDPKRRIEATIVAPGEDGLGFIEEQRALISALCRIEHLKVVPQAVRPEKTIVQPVGEFEIQIPMAGLFDLAAERGRLAKERLKIDAELESLRARLGNPQFVERAKPEVVEESRARVAELEARKRRVEEMLRELGGEAHE